jgi:hypothetical protein
MTSKKHFDSKMHTHANAHPKHKCNFYSNQPTDQRPRYKLFPGIRAKKIVVAFEFSKKIKISVIK